MKLAVHRFNCWLQSPCFRFRRYAFRALVVRILKTVCRLVVKPEMCHHPRYTAAALHWAFSGRGELPADYTLGLCFFACRRDSIFRFPRFSLFSFLMPSKVDALRWGLLSTENSQVLANTFTIDVRRRGVGHREAQSDHRTILHVAEIKRRITKFSSTTFRPMTVNPMHFYIHAVLSWRITATFPSPPRNVIPPWIQRLPIAFPADCPLHVPLPLHPYPIPLSSSVPVFHRTRLVIIFLRRYGRTSRLGLRDQ